MTMVEYQIPKELAEALDSLASKKTVELGFDITSSNLATAAIRNYIKTLGNFPGRKPAQPSSEEWVATVKALQVVLPALGSTANINRMIVKHDGLPHRRLGGRLLFNIPEVMAWMNRRVA